MCCLAKCLLGVALGWAIFFMNLAACGALLAGAFAPWAVYSSSESGASSTLYVNALSMFGTASFGGASLPTVASIMQVSDVLVAATAKTSSIGWTTSSVNTAYVGIAGQVIASASILFYTLISSFLCLCTLCCCCCPQSHVCNALIAAAKAGAALVGVASMGSFFDTLDTALKATMKSAEAQAVALPLNPAVSTLLLTANNSTPAAGAGKGLGSLGVSLLGAVVVLHILQAIQCGGAHHHPAKGKEGVSGPLHK
jgi:hypothetical protein